MELRRRLDFRYVFVGIYIVLFLVYVIVGLRPVQAVNPAVTGDLVIPSIGLESNVGALSLKEHRLETPDTIVGSYTRADNKTLLIGHSTTVFQNLDNVKVGDEVVYNEKRYIVTEIVILAKDEISMGSILKSEDDDTLVIMTCAGELLGGGEATHRLIVTAVAVE